MAVPGKESNKAQFFIPSLLQTKAQAPVKKFLKSASRIRGSLPIGASYVAF